MSVREFHGRVMTRTPANHRYFWGAGALALLTVGAAVASTLYLFLGLLSLTFIALLAGGWGFVTGNKRKPGDLSIDDNGVVVNNQRLPWNEISHAEIAADEMLVLSLRGRNQRKLRELSLSQQSEMAAVLDALKTRGIAARTGASGYAHWFRYFLAPLVLFLKAPVVYVHGGYFGGVVALYACALGLAAITARTAIEIGSDGVRLISNRSTRFLSFASIAHVVSDNPSLVFTLADGSTLRFSCAGAIKKEERGTRIDELVQTIELARTRHSQALSVAASELSAPSQNADEWKVRIKTDGGSGYRSASETTEHLREVVEHPAASPSARVAAAIKWARSGDEQAKTRIRFAAAETASPRLRVALEKASAGEEDAALDEALEAEKLTRG